jgi:hypothetical protein
LKSQSIHSKALRFGLSAQSIDSTITRKAARQGGFSDAYVKDSWWDTNFVPKTVRDKAA